MAQLKETIKDAIKKGDLNSLIVYLANSNSYEELIAIREHKVFYKIVDKKNNAKVIEEYLKAVERVDISKYSEEVNFIQFVEVSSSILDELNKISSNICNELDNFNQYIVINTFCSWMTQKEKEISENMWSSFDAEKYEQLPDKEKAVSLNSYLHELHGVMIDHYRACSDSICKIINNCKNALMIKSDIAPELKIIENLVTISALCNSVNFLIDKVSYGEFNVKNINLEQKVIEFDFVDLDFQIAKCVGMRHIISEREFKSKLPRSISKMFSEIVTEFTFSLAEYFEAENIGVANKKYIQDRIKSELRSLSFNDEVLLASQNRIDHEQIIAAYTAGFIFKSFAFVIESLEIVDHEYDHLKCFTEIPVEILYNYLIGIFENAEIVNKAVNFYFTAYNKLTPLDLLNKPYIKLEEFLVFGIVPFIGRNNWMLTLRREFIKGGKESESYGKYWEDYVTYVFNEKSWNIVGKQVYVKKGKNCLTDIDLIVEKEGLVLLIQAKATADCRTPYEYWKAKNTIIKGMQQADIALKNIGYDSPQLEELLNSKGIDIKSIKKIQAVVITPCMQFSGWKKERIPVLGLGYIISLLNGGKVELVRSEHKEILDTSHHLSKRNNINDLCELLAKPYYFDVYAPNIKKVARNILIGEFRCIIPDTI